MLGVVTRCSFQNRLPILRGPSRLQSRGLMRGGQFLEEGDHLAELRRVAEDTFWLRCAIAAYAGSRALQLLALRWVCSFVAGLSSALGNFPNALLIVHALRPLFCDRCRWKPRSIDAAICPGKAALYRTIRQRLSRSRGPLLDSRSLTGEQVAKIIRQSICERNARFGDVVSWRRQRTSQRISEMYAHGAVPPSRSTHKRLNRLPARVSNWGISPVAMSSSRTAAAIN